MPFLDNEFVLITAPGDPLAKRPWVAVDELAAIPWLMREQGSGTRRLCEVYLDSHQLQPPLLTLGSNGAIKNAARMGLGIALQSREAVELELGFGLLATIRPRGRAAEAILVRGQVDRRSELRAGRGVHRVRAIVGGPRGACPRPGDEIKQTAAAGASGPVQA